MPGHPLVSIGVPTYNSEATIGDTLAAVLAQDHPALEIIVSDNASTDRTLELCRSIAGDDPRVRILVNDENRGWQFNFRRLLAEASGSYFMWVGADDRPAPSFVSANACMLDAHPELVSSVSRVRWLHDGVPGELAAGTAPLTDTPRRNVARYLRHARDNSRFYGLHRTDVLREAFPDDDFYGLDLAVMVGTLRSGGHGEVPEVLLERERSDAAGYVRHIERDARGFADRLLPFRGFTLSIVHGLRAPLSPTTLGWLLVRNVYEHVRYWSTTEGWYGAVTRPVFGLLDRRRDRVSRAADAGSRRGQQ